MKQYSMIGCLFRHPLKVIGRTLLIWFIILFLRVGFNFFTDSKFLDIVTLILSFYLAMKRVQDKTNEEQMMLYRMSPQQQYAYKQQKKSRGLFSRLIRYINKPLTIFGSSSFQNDMSDALYSWMKGDNSNDYASQRAQRDREANERARKRWQAQDNYKKAKWDAQDMYKRGKDIGARQRANDVRYWKNESKKY